MHHARLDDARDIARCLAHLLEHRIVEKSLRSLLHFRSRSRRGVAAVRHRRADQQEQRRHGDQQRRSDELDASHGC